MRHSRDIIFYAKRYWRHLLSGSLNELEGWLVKDMMVSLSNVAKFLGIYDDWRELREWSGLKWRQSVSCEDAFLRLYSGKEDCKHMEEWMDGVKEKLDWDC